MMGVGQKKEGAREIAITPEMIFAAAVELDRHDRDRPWEREDRVLAILEAALRAGDVSIRAPAYVFR